MIQSINFSHLDFKEREDNAYEIIVVLLVFANLIMRDLLLQNVVFLTLFFHVFIFFSFFFICRGMFALPKDRSYFYWYVDLCHYINTVHR